VDKYEYKLKTEEMLELMEDGEYRKAAAAADLIDWKRVRNAGMLMNVSDIYEKTKEYQKSYDVMNLAYRRSEGSRKVIYKLCSLAIKTKNIDEAIDYYDEFIQIAPKDPNRHILRYQILRAQRAPIEQQIEALEEFKKAEYIEEWAYELAKLYREAGMMTECLEECDDLILWFSEGKYVYKAMELKMQYKPLSPSQQQKYDHRYEKLSSETEEIPDLASYLGEDEEKDSASEGAEALGDTRSIGLTEQPVMENDSTSDVIDTDAVTLEAAEEPDAEVENQEEAGVETAEVIEVSEDESEVQPATVETSGDKRTLSKDTASIPIVSKNPVKPVKKKLGDTMRLDEALQQLLNPKPEVQAEPGEEVEPDMTDLEQVETFAAAVAKEYGSIDVWINNAGAMWIKPLMEMSSEEFRREIDLNLTTVFHGAKAAYPYMKAQGSGVILNASSFAALDPNAGRATYSAAKAAVKNLSASMAAEFAAANIRVLAYVPGMIATEIAAESIEKYGDALLADIPCRRFGTPEDLGKVLVFLASDAAGYMNGCHVEISGGKRCVQNPQFSYQ